MSLTLNFKHQIPDLKSACEKVQAAIERFAATHDLTPYLFTVDIDIQPYAIPHSHPVLTLNTRHAADPNRVLALFLHEQIHWHCHSREASTQHAMKELKKLFPAAPTSFDEGGGHDEESTYLHLVVSYLEFQAIKRFLGRDVAVQLFKTADIYAWVCKTVMQDEVAIGEIASRFDLLIEKRS